MGHPTDVSVATIDVGGALVEAVVLRVGNPQCVVLETALDEARYRRLGAALEHHPFFPEGTNVEFACVERADLVRILIWERGVGPTLASGTGACAAAVAAMTLRRRGPRRDRRVARRHPAGGVARRRAVPDGMGRGGLGGQMDPLIRNRQEAVEAVETYSPAEQQFNQRRKTIGLFAAPILFLIVLALPMDTLTPQAHRLAAILVLVVALWVSEALPLPVSALLGPLLAIVLGVAPAPKALASFADPIIFLFIGSFILAEAMYAHGLDRRIAFNALSSPLVGRSAGRLLVVFGGVSVVHVDVDQQHRDRRHDVPHRALHREPPVRAADCQAPPVQAVRDLADAHHGVRRLDRRDGHADRHAAEPHRRGHAAGTGRGADLVLPVDDARPADLDGALRGARHRVLDCRCARDSAARGHLPTSCAASSVNSGRSRAANATSWSPSP